MDRIGRRIVATACIALEKRLLSTVNASHDRLDIAGSWQRIMATVETVPNDVTVGVSLHHLDRGERHEHLGDRPFQAASTIKVLILIAVARALETGTLNPSTRIVPAPHTRVGGSGVLNRLSHDLAPTIADHAWLMTAISDNTASNVLIDAVGFAAICELQGDLGLVATMLHRHFMSTATKRRPQDPSNSVSAADLTTTLAAIATDQVASPERCAWMRSLLGDQQYRDGIARHLPLGVDYAGKTGWQSGIVHDCGLLTGPGGTVALAVLTEGYAEAYPAHELMGKIGELAARIIA